MMADTRRGCFNSQGKQRRGVTGLGRLSIDKDSNPNRLVGNIDGQFGHQLVNTDAFHHQTERLAGLLQAFGHKQACAVIATQAVAIGNDKKHD